MYKLVFTNHLSCILPSKVQFFISFAHRFIVLFWIWTKKKGKLFEKKNCFTYFMESSLVATWWNWKIFSRSEPCEINIFLPCARAIPRDDAYRNISFPNLWFFKAGVTYNDLCLLLSACGWCEVTTVLLVGVLDTIIENKPSTESLCNINVTICTHVNKSKC